MSKYLELNSGKIAEKESTTVSTGVADAGDIVSLGADGKLDDTVLPAGVGPDVVVGTSTEALTSGNYVNLFNNGGSLGVRKADATNGRDAHGYLIESYASGAANVKVYFEGSNTNATPGLTIGARCYLGASGAVTQIPPTQPTFDISQFLGIAVGDSEINTDIDDCILLV